MRKEGLSRQNLLVGVVVTIVLAGLGQPSDAGSAPTASRPGKERQIECMNYYRDHLQEVSGTPFVNDCLRSSEPASAVAARLRSVGKQAGPVTDVARAAAGCVSKEKIEKYVTAECLRDQAGLVVEKKNSSCAGEAGETYTALLAEPGLVFDSSGNRK